MLSIRLSKMRGEDAVDEGGYVVVVLVVVVVAVMVGSRSGSNQMLGQRRRGTSLGEEVVVD